MITLTATHAIVCTDRSSDPLECPLAVFADASEACPIHYSENQYWDFVTGYLLGKQIGPLPVAATKQSYFVERNGRYTVQ